MDTSSKVLLTLRGQVRQCYKDPNDYLAYKVIPFIGSLGYITDPRNKNINPTTGYVVILCGPRKSMRPFVAPAPFRWLQLSKILKLGHLQFSRAGSSEDPWVFEVYKIYYTTEVTKIAQAVAHKFNVHIDLKLSGD